MSTDWQEEALLEDLREIVRSWMGTLRVVFYTVEETGARELHRGTVVRYEVPPTNHPMQAVRVHAKKGSKWPVLRTDEGREVALWENPMLWTTERRWDKTR